MKSNGVANHERVSNLGVYLNTNLLVHQSQNGRFRRQLVAKCASATEEQEAMCSSRGFASSETVAFKDKLFNIELILPF